MQRPAVVPLAGDYGGQALFGKLRAGREALDVSGSPVIAKAKAICYEFRMGLYLLLIKFLVAGNMTAHFLRYGDARYHAGLMTWVQAFFLLFFGNGLWVFLFGGVFIFTLWYGFFHFLEYLENRHTGWTFLAILIAFPLILQL